MKNVLLSLSIALFLLNVAAPASAQYLTQTGKDTSIGAYAGGSTITVFNALKSVSANPVYLKWNVIPVGTSGGSKFDAGWDMVGTGICDNVVCYSHAAFNPILTNGAVYKSAAYSNKTFVGDSQDFHVIFVPNNPANGTSAMVRINTRDTVSNLSRTLTFIAYKGSLGVSNISSSDDIILYPNPAREAINVVYDESTGVKTIAIYNLIGKLMGPIYKPASNGSAKIDLDDMPTGIYFLRLMNGQGHVVATRRFTRQ